MTILDFQEHIVQSNVKKGLDYYNKKKVSDIVEINGEWSASVEGRETYEVHVSVQGKYVTHTSCDCGAFNHEDHCKHVVAVLCAINGNLFQPEEIETTVTTFLLSLLNSLSAEDLRLFVLQELHDDDYLVKDLAVFAETSIDNAAVTKHIETINTAFKHVANIEDYPSGEPGTLAVKPANRLLEQAKKAYLSGDVTTAIDIAFALLLKKPAFDYCEEDESGSYDGIVEKAFLLLDEICTGGELNEYNSRRIARRSWKGLWSEDYDLDRFKIHWVDLLVRYGWGEEEKKGKLLEMLDNLMKNAKKKNYSSDYARLSAAKQAIVNGTGRVEKMITKMPGMPSSSEQALKILPPPPAARSVAPKENKAPVLSEKKIAYMQKKAALISQLETEKAEGIKTTYHSLQKELILLMQQNSDVFGVREIAGRFYEETGELFFYESLKDTYMASEWEKLTAARDPGKTNQAIVRKMNDK